MRELKNYRATKFYFLGVGGASMSALAKYVLSAGGEVVGYDASRSSRTDELQSKGVKIYFSQEVTDEEKAAINSADEIVCTSAITAGNLRYDECLAQGKKIVPRGEFLAKTSGAFRDTIAVAGSHGKTTCTCMCAHIFYAANEPFAMHAGGEDLLFSNYFETGKKFFITEACEYKKNLLKLSPSLSVLLNADRDHMECYGGEEELIGAFSRYCNAGKRALVCADDEKITPQRFPYPSFGIENKNAYYKANSLESDGERYSFDFCENNRPLCRVKLRVAGRVNVYNALAAGAAARTFGLSAESVAAGLNAFSGVKRRFEKVGEKNGAAYICDYAHHPREIAAALNTAEKLTKNRLYVIFQPHTYSRTETLFSEFVRSLSLARNLLIFKEYAARERYNEHGSAKRLAQCVGGAAYAQTQEEIEQWIAGRARAGDTVLFLGAGDIYERAKSMVAEAHNGR
ncbi:MAG: Mur ligase family protein [Candidatus Borkfalkiaceae bacterium]|nr:Mur ligase family protein [Clostridia bacterium]MDY6223425.1 Mur ligase family protein [Christensenellaceae bacterium]